MKQLAYPREALSKDSRHYTDVLRFCEANRSHVLAAIPFMAAEIAERCGFAVLFRLVSWRGGGSAFVHVGTEADCVLRRHAGDEAHAWFAENHGGENIVIPLCSQITNLYRRHLVARMRAEGATIAEIARDSGVHGRSVERWIKKQAAEEARRAKPQPGTDDTVVRLRTEAVLRANESA